MLVTDYLDIINDFFCPAEHFKTDKCLVFVCFISDLCPDPVIQNALFILYIVVLYILFIVLHRSAS